MAKVKKQKMMLCHMQKGELEGLDNLQGGPSVGPDGFREYSKLALVIENPSVQQLFHHINDELVTGGKVSPDLNNIYKSSKKVSLPFLKSREEQQEPQKSFEELGRGKDKELAWLPENLVLFLLDFLPDGEQPRINPKTGLLEFGFNIGKVFSAPFRAIQSVTKSLPEIIRIGGTIGGAILGGPVGAGVGNMLGHLATGNNASNSLMSGLKNLGLVGGLQTLAGAFPGAAGAITGNMGPASGIANSFLGLGENATGSFAGLGETISKGLGGLGGVGKGAGLLGAGMLMPTLLAGLTAKGEYDEHKQNKKIHEQYEAEKAKVREEMGFNRSLPRKKLSFKHNPKRTDSNSLTEPLYTYHMDEYKEGGLVHSYKKGDLIKGPGDGQADKIKTSVPEGSYILSADVVSAFGNGSSRSGGKILKDFENHVQREFSHLIPQVEKQIRSKKEKKVPVYLSNDEYSVAPLTVSLIGKGSEDVGAKLLKNLMHNVRADQMRNGTNLPPKTKHPIHYLRGS